MRAGSGLNPTNPFRFQDARQGALGVLGVLPGEDIVGDHQWLETSLN
jgi:hypothetical protein